MIALPLLLAVGVGTAAPLEGTAHVVTDVLRGVSALPRGELQEVFVRFRGDELRIDFQDSRGRDFALMRRPGAPIYVLSDSQGGALPIPGAQLPLIFEAEAPCRSLGILSECTRLADGVRAGRNAVRWQYRRANRGGPGGTDTGTMWLDRETGFVLGYEAQSRGASERKIWDVLDIQYGPVESSWFLPAVAPPSRAAPRPAAAVSDPSPDSASSD